MNLSPQWRVCIERARGVPIEQVAMVRGLKLKRGRHEWTGPCPVHGGRDRFAIDLRKQLFVCRGAGGGRVIDFLIHLDGCDFATAVKTLNAMNCGYSPPSSRPSLLAPDNGEFALRIWREAVNPANTPAQRYLAARGVLDLLPDGALGDVLRFHPVCPFNGEHVPCLVALVRDIHTDQPRAVHRIAIEYEVDGSIRINGVRRMALGPIKGGVIKLTDHAEVTTYLGIGEGIESTLSMRRRPGFGTSPVWSLISADGIGTFPVLAGIEVLFIAVDNDENSVGQTAAAMCMERWTAADAEVFRLTPKAIGADLNDVVGLHHDVHRRHRP
jgi:hypothetical protein